MKNKLTLEFSGDPETMKMLVERLRKIAVEKMRSAKDIDQAKKIWEQWQPFQNDIDFFDAKEQIKKRLL